jgi:hypothetical protein
MGTAFLETEEAIIFEPRDHFSAGNRVVRGLLQIQGARDEKGVGI